jgi:APA family basic amino acid/polyamine antiporter
VPLLRILGVAFGVAIIVGTSIGAGILRTPGAVAAHLGSGPLSLFAWMVGGVYALLGAAALAELATSIPKSGGFYVYARRALGDGFGFAVGWADWVNNCAAVSYASVVMGEFLALLIPSLTPQIRTVAAATIVGVGLLQWCGMSVSSRLQEAAAFIKAIAFLAFIVALLVLPVSHADEGPAIAGALPGFVSIVLAMQLVLGAYDGWQSGLYFAGEDRDPTRNLPRAFIGGAFLVLVVYVLMNIALVRVLPMATLASSALPAADAARAVLGARGETIVTILAVLSPLSIISGVLLSAARVPYAMGSDGLMPSAAGFVDQRGTPSVGLLLSAIVALALLGTGTFESIATVFAFFAITSYVGAFVSLLVIRRREPHLPRPFRSWGYPWTTIVVLAGACSLLAGLVAGAPRQSLIAIAALAASYPVFRLTRVRSVRL